MTQLKIMQKMMLMDSIFVVEIGFTISCYVVYRKNYLPRFIITIKPSNDLPEAKAGNTETSEFNTRQNSTAKQIGKLVNRIIILVS